MGGGVGISCHAPIRIATNNTVYAMPESRIGFFTDVGGSYFLPRVSDNISLGLYLGVTGFRLKASDLLQWGVATNFVESEKIPELYEEIKQSVTESSTLLEVSEIVHKHSD